MYMVHCVGNVPLYKYECSVQAMRDKHTHHRQHSDGQFFASKRSHHRRTASEVPHTTPHSTPQAPPYCQHLAGNHSILLRLPVLFLKSQGNMPSLNVPTSQKKKNKANRPRSTERQSHFVVTVNVTVSGSVSAALSPPSTLIISRYEHVHLCLCCAHLYILYRCPQHDENPSTLFSAARSIGCAHWLFPGDPSFTWLLPRQTPAFKQATAFLFIHFS